MGDIIKENLNPSSDCCLISSPNGPGRAAWLWRLTTICSPWPLATIPAVITGILAWQFALDGHRLKGILLLHLIMGCTSTVLTWIVWLIHWKTQREQGAESPTYRLPVEVVAVAMVALTGHLGGFLSGVNIPS
jgi:hypothetical protein